MAKFDLLHITQKSNLQKKVLKIMHRTGRPVLIGELAVELHENIDIIEECLTQMCDQSIDNRQIELVQKNSQAYKQYDGVVPLYHLIVKQSLVVAHGEDEVRGPKPMSRPPTSGSF